MALSRISTRRPVAITMIAISVLLFGFVALSRLPVTLLPDLSYPTLTVRTELAGAAPEEVETLLARPIEEALGVIKGVRQVRSVSRPGSADVTLELAWGSNIDYAVLDVREKLDVLELPDEAERPVVLRFDPGEDPIVRLGLAFAPALDAAALGEDPARLKRLRRTAEDVIQRPLESVPGVAAVKISGGLEDEIQVRVDIHKLAAANLKVSDIVDRLQAENANISGGRIDEGSASYLVRTLNQFASLDEIRDTILLSANGRNLYLKDVAEVVSGFKERESIIRVDGQEAVEIALYKEGDGNTVRAAQTALKRIEQLRKALPPDMRLITLYDQSIFISQAIDSVAQGAAFGGVLAVLVLYLFLRNAWTTAVVSIAIPVSVIATFNFMYGAGLSLNIMSLGGIALAIGMLVDNAIVVLENIARKREQGLDALSAAETGAQEMAGAVTASTLTTVAVFFPLVFVDGIAGQLFADQALVVTASLLVSLVVAMTLIPMLAARAGRETELQPAAPVSMHAGRLRRGLARLRWLLLEQVPAALLMLLVWLWRLIGWLGSASLGRLAALWQRSFALLQARYASALQWTLRQRWSVLLAVAALSALALGAGRTLGVELIPPFNQGEFVAELRLAPGTPIERSDAVLSQLSVAHSGDPRLAANYSVAGTGNRLDANAEAGGENYGTLNFVLKPEAFAEEAALMHALRGPLAQVPGLDYRFTRPTLFTLNTPLEIEITGFDLNDMSRVAAMLRSQLQANDRFSEVESTLKPGHPELQLLFDQERAAALGLDTAELADRVVAAVQGEVATRFRLADRDIDVLVRADVANRSSAEALSELLINPESERPLRLSAVARLQLDSGPSEIRRIDQQRVIVVSANIEYGDLGEAVVQVERMIAALALPTGVRVEVSGQSEEMERSFRSLQLALALAVFLVYVVMAAQFESLRQPLVILFTVPLAGIGAVLSLWISGETVSVVALIGCIVLAGIVVNNGIVMIDTINRLRDSGMARAEAIVEGASTRLRPIMMTTLTTVLGLLPVALSGQEGAEISRPMAVVVVGGLSAATLLTLFVIPVLYTLIDRGDRRSGAAAPAGDGVGAGA